MKTKHTPGPWRVGTDDRSIFTVRGTTSAGMQHIATAAGCASLNDADLRANARLIAAAPELAEACQALIALVDGPKPVNSNTVADVHVLARAALRKAGVIA